MTAEEKREHNRQWYRENREKVCAKNRARYKKLGKRKKEQLKESKRKWLDESENGRELQEKRRRMYNSEEYRAKRRAAYAAKHANDPMTEHRRRCIEAAQKRTAKPLADRKAEKFEREAQEQAMKDIRAEQLQESHDRFIERMTEKLMTQFYDHATGKRKGNVTIHLHTNDNSYFMRRAAEYHRLGERLTKLDPVKEYTERNIIVHKRNVIWQEFTDLYQKYYYNKPMSE